MIYPLKDQMIISKHPNLKGLKFWFAYVAEAPAYLGMEHVGEDMFVSIHSAEGIFIVTSRPLK